MAMSPERTAAVVAHLQAIDARRNLPFGILAGLAGALIGAAIWAVITVTTHYQIGFMAIGVAFLVGFGMRQFGSGRTKIFGIAGGAISLLGSVFGNIGTVYAGFSIDQNLGAGAFAIPFVDVAHIAQANFSIMDVVFYAIAAYYGYHYSMRKLTKNEIAALPA